MTRKSGNTTLTALVARGFVGEAPLFIPGHGRGGQITLLTFIVEDNHYVASPASGDNPVARIRDLCIAFAP